MELQARYLVGAKSLLNGPGKDLYEHAKALNNGPVDRRLRFVVLAGELAGPEEALTQLNELDAKLVKAGVNETPEQVAVSDDLRRLYSDYAARRLDAPSVTKEQRQQIRHELGWFGELALAPPEDP